jgi:hypothetical protein
LSEKEDLALEILTDFFNAVEAGIAQAKQRIKEAKLGSEQKPSWDSGRIKWVEAQGTSGPYQRYPGEGQKAESTEDYRNMLADLKAHGGKLSRKESDGATWFYWLFQDASTVGRKQRK